MIPGIYNVEDCSISRTIRLLLLEPYDYNKWFEKQSIKIKTLLFSQNSNPDIEDILFIFNHDGLLTDVVAIVNLKLGMWTLSHLPSKLPIAYYHLDSKNYQLDFIQISLGWSLSHYKFTRYNKKNKDMPKLVMPKKIIHDVKILRDGMCMVRDMINTPSLDMNPDSIENIFLNISKEFNVNPIIIKGINLLKENFPAIYHVGKAGLHKPRLLYFKWGNKNHPIISIIGKGVCFDTGGLDLKSASAMRSMKKDMAGAAHAMALAKMIMIKNIPVRIHLYIPTVQNSIDKASYCPGDVISMRNGTQVEIENTDAEGRLILADTLTKASSYHPKLIIDFATLTGAGRVALGPTLSALFSNNKKFTNSLIESGYHVQDEIWELPLYYPYKKMLNSNIADIMNASSDPYGGAITAALFLEHFIKDKINWMHLDIMAWNVNKEWGRPIGGEGNGLRAVFHFLCKEFQN